MKIKARLVAKGFLQVPGVDFEETFVPVGRTTSFRILLSIAASANLEIYQADVEGAYLNGKITQEIYMEFPEGIEPMGTGTNTALRLKGSLYGLKQSGRTWWIELGAGLAELGFKKLESDWGLYHKASAGQRGSITVLAYDCRRSQHRRQSSSRPRWLEKALEDDGAGRDQPHTESH